MTKILWHSNAMWSTTGYGSQTRLFAPMLAEEHDIAVSAFWGLNGAPLTYDGIKHFPNVGDPYGNDVVQAHAENHFGGPLRSGAVISLIDVWVLQPPVWRTMNAACWTPVDHDPPPPMVRGFFEESGAVPIAMSRFGERMLAPWEPLYVPHGVDTTVFKPGDRAKAREALDLPNDRFIVGMVAANKGRPSRKALPEALEAFARLLKEHDDALLYLHTEATGVADGEPLGVLLGALEIPQESVRFADQYTLRANPPDDEQMAGVFNAMDVLLSPSRGEGFGIPILEAQACGTPVIVTDFSAMAELGEVGWKVNGQRFWTGQLSWQVTPDVNQIAWALGEAYNGADRLRERARDFALRYDARKVYEEHWKPTLAALEQRFAERDPVEIPQAVAA